MDDYTIEEKDKEVQKLKKVRRKFRKALSYRGKMKQGIH